MAKKKKISFYNPDIEGLCVFEEENSFTIKIVETVKSSNLLFGTSILLFLVFLILYILVYSQIYDIALSKELIQKDSNARKNLLIMVSIGSLGYIGLNQLIWYLYLQPNLMEREVPLWEKKISIHKDGAMDDLYQNIIEDKRIYQLGVMYLENNCFEKVKMNFDLIHGPFKLDELRSVTESEWTGFNQPPKNMLLVAITQNHNIYPIIPLSFNNKIVSPRGDRLGERSSKLKIFTILLYALYREFPSLRLQSYDYIHEGGLIYTKFGHGFLNSLIPVKNLKGDQKKPTLIQWIKEFFMMLE